MLLLCSTSFHFYFFIRLKREKASLHADNTIKNKEKKTGELFVRLAYIFKPGYIFSLKKLNNCG